MNSLEIYFSALLPSPTPRATISHNDVSIGHGCGSIHGGRDRRRRRDLARCGRHLGNDLVRRERRCGRDLVHREPSAVGDLVRRGRSCVNDLVR